MDLKEFLTENNISQASFAKKMGVTPARISQTVHKKTNPSLDLARRIIKETNGKVTVGDLFNPEAPTRIKSRKKENGNTHK